jgi:hypothetical protein
MADTKTADDPKVKAYLVHNTSVNGQILLADTVQELPRSVATELRDRGAVRKPTADEVATLFRATAETPPFGEEPDEEAAEEEAAAPPAGKGAAAK